MNWNPIYLFSSGRSGSTLTMKILSLHPEILVRSLFPYETRASQYYYLCYKHGHKQISFSPVKLKNTEYRPFLLKDKDSITWSSSQLTKELGDFGSNFIEDYYSFLSQLEEKRGASYFAEKTIGLHLLKLILEDFPSSKVVFLYRDPRDIFFSAKSFNKRLREKGRSKSFFGEHRGDHAMYSQIIESLKKAKKLSNSIGSNAFNVTYEDIIERRNDTIRVMFESLGLEQTEKQIDEILQFAFEENKDTQKHKTTETGKSSIGKWKKESDSETIAMFENFSDDLKYLGYK